MNSKQKKIPPKFAKILGCYIRQGFPSLAGCREEPLDPPDLAMATVAACSMFRGKEIRPLGFSRREELIGEGAASSGTRWSHHRWARKGLGRAP
jgi:hypothetical protein